MCWDSHFCWGEPTGYVEKERKKKSSPSQGWRLAWPCKGQEPHWFPQPRCWLSRLVHSKWTVCGITEESAMKLHPLTPYPWGLQHQPAELPSAGLWLVWWNPVCCPGVAVSELWSPLRASLSWEFRSRIRSALCQALPWGSRPVWDKPGPRSLASSFQSCTLCWLPQWLWANSLSAIHQPPLLSAMVHQASRRDLGKLVCLSDFPPGSKAKTRVWTTEQWKDREIEREGMCESTCEHAHLQNVTGTWAAKKVNTFQLFGWRLPGSLAFAWSRSSATVSWMKKPKCCFKWATPVTRPLHWEASIVGSPYTRGSFPGLYLTRRGSPLAWIIYRPGQWDGISLFSSVFCEYRKWITTGLLRLGLNFAICDHGVLL